MSSVSEEITAAEAKARKAAKKKKPAQLHIIPEYCKGCGICVAFCPTQVLEMKGGKVNVAHLDACISCLFCELRCPDFAISVEPVEE